MNQPIPRSFFRDGQKAILDGRNGVIHIRNRNIETIFFIEDFSFLETTLLCHNEVLYAEGDLELLDRTIDQVMEGDGIISKKGEVYDVCGRCGSVVFFLEKGNRKVVFSSTVSYLQDEGFTILHPTEEEETNKPLTAERAKELREESINNPDKYIPKKDTTNYFVTRDGSIRDASEKYILSDIYIGNCFPYTPEGKKQAEAWRDKYLPAFLFELQNKDNE